MKRETCVTGIYKVVTYIFSFTSLIFVKFAIALVGKQFLQVDLLLQQKYIVTNCNM